MLKNEHLFYLSLVCLLVVATAIGWNPACSVIALALVFTQRLVEKFFESELQSIKEIKADLAKVAAKQQRQEMGSVFKPGSNG